MIQFSDTILLYSMDFVRIVAGSFPAQRMMTSPLRQGSCLVFKL